MNTSPTKPIGFRRSRPFAAGGTISFAAGGTISWRFWIGPLIVSGAKGCIRPTFERYPGWFGFIGFGVCIGWGR